MINMVHLATRLCCGLVLLLLVKGCSSSPVNMTEEMRTQMAKTAEDLMIVDCLLPGQLRKLGSQATYLTARRPIKTSAVDCEIRGGEYVAFDRANYATALKIWLPFAMEKDPQAQTYVGEIYEKGIGSQSDYEAAAMWYERAALQGFSRAQINLGHLYEKGLGVAQDLSKALELYRAASGLDENELAYASTIAAAKVSQEKLEELKALALQKDQEIKRLNRKLSQVEAQLDALTTETARAESRADLLAERIQQLKATDEKSLDGVETEKKLREELSSLKQLLREEQLRSDREVTQFTEEVQALAEQKRLVIAALEEQLQFSRSKVAEKQALIASLERQSKGYSASLSAMSSDAAQIAMAPTIEIIDPPMMLTRGRPTVKLRSAVSTKEVIGKVVAPAGLASLKINDRQQPVDQYNLFWAEVPILRANNPVEIVAIDRQGQRVSLSFAFVTNTQPLGGNRLWSDTQDESAAIAARTTESMNMGNYYALVIGNNEYQHFTKLETAVNDAEEAAKVLSEQYGYQTTLLLNADRYAILSELNRFRSQLTEKDNLLVYYAGHGELDRLNQRGYWLPVDAEPSSPTNWISNVAISDIFNAMSAKHVMVVADSCYAGTLSSSSVARTTIDMPPEAHAEWVKIMSQTRARTVLTSGGIAPVLDGGGGNHSIFANAFLDVLRNNTGMLEGYSLYREVLETVRRRSLEVEMGQVPDYAPIKHAGHEAGEFFFRAAQTDS